MGNTNSDQAKPAPQIDNNDRGSVVRNLRQERRDAFAREFGAAILSARPTSTPTSLAKQVTDLTDAFIAALDGAK